MICAVRMGEVLKMYEPPKTHHQLLLAIIRTETFYHCSDGSKRNPGGFVRFAESLANETAHVYAVVPVAPAQDDGLVGETFTSTRVSMIALPQLKGLRLVYQNGSRALKKIVASKHQWHIANLRAPDNFFPLASRCLLSRGIPFYVHLVVDPRLASTAPRGGIVTSLIAHVSRSVQLRALRTCLSRGVLCITHGRSVAEWVKGQSARAVSLSSGGVWSSEISHETRSHKPLASKLLYVGRISKEKGLSVLIRALGKLNRRDLSLTIVGWSFRDYQTELCRLLCNLGLEKCVKFEGPVRQGPDLLRHYREHDVFVLPSLVEGTPRVVLEALAQQLPVIATDVGGTSDNTDDGKAAVLVPPNDVDKLATAIALLCDDHARRCALAKAGLRFVKTVTLETQAAKHAKFVHEELALRRNYVIGGPKR